MDLWYVAPALRLKLEIASAELNSAEKKVRAIFGAEFFADFFPHFIQHDRLHLFHSPLLSRLLRANNEVSELCSKLNDLHLFHAQSALESVCGAQ